MDLWEIIEVLVRMLQDIFEEIGSTINYQKTYIINIKEDALVEEKFEICGETIKSVGDHHWRYNWNLLKKLKKNVHILTNTPYLKEEQKKLF